MPRGVITSLEQMGEIMEDTAKFREAIVYIADKCREDRKFGAVKLNKILYYSDFRAYRTLRQSITGSVYQHLREGPAPRGLVEIRQSLIGDGSIELQRRMYFNRVQHSITAIRDPDISVFRQEELDIIDEVIEDLWNMNGSEVSELSHQEIGWQVTEESETIPLRTAWISAQPLSPEQIDLGKEVADRHELRG